MMSVSDQRIYHLLQLAAHNMRVYADEQCLAAASITTAQAAALHIISGKPGITQRGVAMALKQRESAMTAMVKRLCEAKMLERRESNHDSRAWALFLTDKGSAALEKIKEPLNHINARLSAAIGSSDVNQLAEILRSMAAIPAAG
jgi:MarR family transcriptional regulator, organic hydroperoxide resistance regulator